MDNERESDPAGLSGRLETLREEHRDLDAAIAGLNRSPVDDDLLLRRLKKRKLALRDRIDALERLLEPDDLA